jgi:hypothetical protein
MQIAIAVGTLLLGGWVLETPEETKESAVPEQISPSVTVPGGVAPAETPAFTPSQGVSGYQGLQGVRTMQHGRSLGRAPGESTESIRSRLTGSNQVGAGARQQREPSMPLSPTETLPPGAETTLGQPSAPTSTGSPLSTNVSGGGAKSQALNLSVPTERPPQMLASEVGNRAVSRGLDQSRSVQATGVPNIMAPPVQPSTEKAFAGYHTSSGISPYMNIFRSGTNNGTVDNYTTLVRPQLDQRALNQQYGRDIRGLQSDSRLQGSSLQQINQSRQLQGVSTPQFYMNYGNYYSYPGAGQGP